MAHPHKNKSVKPKGQAAAGTKDPAIRAVGIRAGNTLRILVRLLARQAAHAWLQSATEPRPPFTKETEENA